MPAALCLGRCQRCGHYLRSWGTASAFWCLGGLQVLGHCGSRQSLRHLGNDRRLQLRRHWLPVILQPIHSRVNTKPQQRASCTPKRKRQATAARSSLQPVPYRQAVVFLIELHLAILTRYKIYKVLIIFSRDPCALAERLDYPIRAPRPG